MLIIRKKKIAELKSDPNNARVHNKKNLKMIKSSLLKYGQVEPLVLNRRTGTLIGGNGRLEAMRGLGWTECEVVEVDLDDSQATHLSLVLNRTAETSEWDDKALSDLLTSLGSDKESFEMLGWEKVEIKKIIANAESKPVEKYELKFATLKVTEDQHLIIKQACELVRKMERDESLSKGRCLELICADWIAGAESNNY